MRHIIFWALYMKTFLRFICCGESAGGYPLRRPSVSFVPVKGSPGERALVALSPTLESLVARLYCNQFHQPNHPCRLVQAPPVGESFPVFCVVRATLLLTPTFEDLNNCHDPLLLQDVAGHGQPLTALPFSNPEIPIMLYSEHENAHMCFVALKGKVCISCYRRICTVNLSLNNPQDNCLVSTHCITA